jgi:hypothetical protein
MSTAPVSLRESEKQCTGCLLEDDDGAMRLESLLDLLRIFLGDTLFEYLWHRLDKLLCLETQQYSAKNSAKKKGEK